MYSVFNRQLLNETFSYDEKSKMAGSMEAVKRKEADKKAREEYLAKKAAAAEASKPTVSASTKPTEPSGPKQTFGIHSANPLIRNKAIGGVKILMREPLRHHEASKKLSKHTTDPKLLNSLEKLSSLKGFTPDTDVRPVVKQHMRSLGHKGF